MGVRGLSLYRGPASAYALDGLNSLSVTSSFLCVLFLPSFLRAGVCETDLLRIVVGGELFLLAGVSRSPTTTGQERGRI